MALLTGWTGKEGYTGPDNRVQDEGLKSIPVFMAWTDDYLVAHAVNIVTTTERFRYVGMTYATALLCQSAMIAAYAHNGTIQAGISVTPQGGHMWQCEVSSCVVTIVIVPMEDL